jgi:hypothetical protein
METAGKEAEVGQEYRDLLAKEPGNTELMYLASRVEEDHARATALCEQALAGQPPCAYAAYSLAWRHMAAAEFDQAARRMAEAIRLAPGGGGLEFKNRLRDALLASGRFDEALELIRQTPDASLSMAVARASEESYAQLLAGRKREADTLVSTLKLRLQSGGGSLAGTEAVNRISAQLAYANGDKNAYVTVLSQSSSAARRVEARLTSGELEVAERDLAAAAAEETSARNDLLFYLAATRAGRSDLADKHLADAVKLLAAGKREQRAFAAALDGRPTMPTAQLVAEPMEPEEKVVLLTAVGVRDPGAREPCFALARKLNYDRRFPHLLLREIHDGMRQ